MKLSLTDAIAFASQYVRCPPEKRHRSRHARAAARHAPKPAGSQGHTRERARVEKADGFQQLKAKLPPVSRRGLILIDPPYEMKTDYQAVVSGIAEGYKRFATGTYALWYPVVLRQQIKRMIHDLEATGIRKILQIELAVLPDSDRRGMTASGMIVINPPWKLEQQMNNVLPWLHSKLVPAGTGHATVSWIVPE